MSRRTLEAQSGVGAGKGVAVHVDVVHAAAEFRPDDETAVGVVHAVVLYVDVLARPVGRPLGSRTSFHADAVVAGIDGVVHDEHVAAVSDVDGVAVLRVPRAGHGDAVHDDVGAPLGHQVEPGRIA